MDWNERFSADEYLFGTQPAQALVRHGQHFTAGDRVLCIADGEGRNSVWLAEQGCAVTAWDGSRNAIDKARRLAEARRVNVVFHHADAATYDWPADNFDAVVGIFFQFAPPALRGRIFAGMQRCIRPGGLIFVHGYTHRQLHYGTGGPKDADQLYSHSLLATAFAGCDIIILEEYEAELCEGTGHNGRSAVIDLVARRR